MRDIMAHYLAPFYRLAQNCHTEVSLLFGKMELACSHKNGIKIVEKKEKN